LYTPSIEEFLKRAYPLDDVPPGATTAARNGWGALCPKEAICGGEREVSGPSIASVPGVLNSLGDSAPYITAGRVTALALAPNCGEDRCRLYVGAAGGGVWRTNHALGDSAHEWEFISGSFGTNAIG